MSPKPPLMAMDAAVRKKLSRSRPVLEARPAPTRTMIHKDETQLAIKRKPWKSGQGQTKKALRVNERIFHDAIGFGRRSQDVGQGQP